MPGDDFAAAPVAIAVATDRPTVLLADGPDTTRKELFGWYIYDWANSVYSTVVIGGFLPILLQRTALDNTGFPEICPNIVRNMTSVRTIFNDSAITEMFTWVDNIPTSTCDGEIDTDCRGIYCPGLPDAPSQCLQTNGKDLFPLRVDFGAVALDPTSYTSLFLSLSVLLQAIVFISLGLAADRYKHNKRLFMAVSYIGSLLTCTSFLITKEVYWYGSIVLIGSNVMYGTSFIFYNAYLSPLARNLPEVKRAYFSEGLEAAIRVYTIRMEEISSLGFALGYAAGVLCLLCTIGIVLGVESPASYAIACTAAGLWWTLFSTCTFIFLKNRISMASASAVSSGSAEGGQVKNNGETDDESSLSPTPAADEEEMLRSAASTQSSTEHSSIFRLVTASWVNIGKLGRDLLQLKQCTRFLMLWFMYSDAFSVISTVGALFAATEIDFGCLGTTTGVLILFIEIPLAAVCGSLLFSKITSTWQLETLTMIRITLVVFMILPIIGCIGFINPEYGLRYGWQMFAFGWLYGLALGPVQSYSRCMYTLLIPHYRESEFFSLFEITDKGSSWIGPAVIAALVQGYGDMKLGFIYILVLLFVSFVLLGYVDVERGRAEAHEFSSPCSTIELTQGVKSRDGATTD